MKTKHTPGPWNDTTIKAIPSKPCTKHNYIGGPSNQWIAATLCCGATTYEERNANSRLIAAAPELLSALRTLIAQADRHGAEGVYWDEARAAIAKATRDPGCTCHMKEQATGPVPHCCRVHDGDYMSFLASHNCD